MKVAWIGAGNMGGALIRGLLKSDRNIDILVYDQDPQKIDAIPPDHGWTACQSAREACKDADVSVFALKPGITLVEMERLRDVLEGKVVISVAAGIRLEDYERVLSGSRIIRAMTNMAVLVGEGMTTLALGIRAGEKELSLATNLFGRLGRVLVLPEELMNAATALAGSGPAFLFLFLEAMEEAGMKMGLSQEASRQLAVQGAYGATRMLLTGEAAAAALRAQVCSPGGATLAGLAALEEADFFRAVLRAVQVAAQRAEDLGRQP